MEAENVHDRLETLNSERLCENNILSNEVADLRKKEVLMEDLRNHLEDIVEQLPKLTVENSSLKEQVRNGYIHLRDDALHFYQPENIPDYTLCFYSWCKLMNTATNWRWLYLTASLRLLCSLSNTKEMKTREEMISDLRIHLEDIEERLPNISQENEALEEQVSY